MCANVLVDKVANLVSQSTYGIGEVCMVLYSIAQLNSWKEYVISIWLCSTQCCLLNIIYLFSIIHWSIFTNIPRKVNFALWSTHWICYTWLKYRQHFETRITVGCSSFVLTKKKKEPQSYLLLSPFPSLPVSLMPFLSVSLSIWLLLVVSL